MVGLEEEPIVTAPAVENGVNCGEEHLQVGEIPPLGSVVPVGDTNGSNASSAPPPQSTPVRPSLRPQDAQSPPASTASPVNATITSPAVALMMMGQIPKKDKPGNSVTPADSEPVPSPPALATVLRRPTDPRSRLRAQQQPPTEPPPPASPKVETAVSVVPTGVPEGVPADNSAAKAVPAGGSASFELPTGLILPSSVDLNLLEGRIRSMLFSVSIFINGLHPFASHDLQ